jgi:hypothetical protein
VSWKLISLSFLAGICFFQNQVYRRAAEIAEEDFFCSNRACPLKGSARKRETAIGAETPPLRE